MEGYRTFVAATIGFIGAGLNMAGIDIDKEGLTNAVMVLAGFIGTIYYRYKATKQYTKKY